MEIWGIGLEIWRHDLLPRKQKTEWTVSKCRKLEREKKREKERTQEKNLVAEPVNMRGWTIGRTKGVSVNLVTSVDANTMPDGVSNRTFPSSDESP